MSELLIHASPALRRFVSMPPQEITEAGFEPVGVVTARIVDKLMLLASLQKEAA